MPIRTRGELPDPCITAVRDQFTRPASNTIDTDVYIEISIEASDCQIYFTTNGSMPAPFKRWIGAREVTFRYTAPFALKSGKRVVKAVAVSRDGLLESRVVSKTFKVHDYGYDSTDSESYLEEDYSDAYLDSDSTNRSRRTWRTCRSWTQGRRSRSQPRPASADQGWITSTRRYPYVVETVGSDYQRDQRPAAQIPDGPFNPVNYSGTQINVWGAPPGSVWPAPPGVVTYGNMVPTTTSRPVQRGLLTKEMMENTKTRDSATSDDDSRPLTVAEARRIIAESEAETSAAEQPETNKKKKEKTGVGSGSISFSAETSASEQPETSKKKKEKSGVRSGNISFSGLSRSGAALLSSYRNKKK